MLKPIAKLSAIITVFFMVFTLLGALPASSPKAVVIPKLQMVSQPAKEPVLLNPILQLQAIYTFLEYRVKNKKLMAAGRETKTPLAVLFIIIFIAELPPA